MSFNDIPQELVSLIIDYLQNDRESLKAASLASPLFLPVCRKYLFKQLCINSFNPVFDYQCSAWADIIQKSAEILQFVRILEIGPPLLRFRSLWSMQSVFQANAPFADPARPSINDPRLESILSGIKHPQSITFRFELSQWRIIIPPLQKAIRALVSQESLTSLTLEDVNDFPLDILWDCKGLLNLTLISVHPSTTSTRNANSHKTVGRKAPKRGSLDTLTLMTSDESIEQLISSLASPLGLFHLRKLFINMGLMNSKDIIHKLSRKSPNITYIMLRLINQDAYDFYSPEDFLKLQTLFISVSYNRHHRPIQALASFLSRFKSGSPLEELTILFRLDVPQLEHENNSQWLERICNSRDWQLVEEQCLVGRRFPLLNKMSIVFRPKDVKTYLSDYLAITMPLLLLQVMPTLYALTSTTIECFEDQFEAHQYA